MTAALSEIAYAKINLALHVRAREADDYHRIETLFAFAGDGDVLTAKPADVLTLKVTGPFASPVLETADNLVLRAAEALRLAAGYGSAYSANPLGAAIILEKRLPVASGIGGGSADAAAALRLLARLWDIAISEDALMAIARTLGADVPACLASRPVRGTGRGDRLHELGEQRLAGAPLLLVNPGEPVSTAAVFRGWDGIDRGPLAEGDPLAAARTGRNDLEAPAHAIAPVIRDVTALLSAQPGISLARMSGSGATCFALFESITDRDRACAGIAEAHPDWWCLKSALR